MYAGPSPSQAGWHPVPGVTADLPQAWTRGEVFSHLLQWFWLGEFYSSTFVHCYLSP